MSMAADTWDTFLSLVCYGAYAWCASRFLKKQLNGKRWEEGVFGGLLFFGYGIAELFMENSGMPYILYAVCCHMLLTGLTLAVFKEEREKKLMAAAVLAVMSTLIWNFSDSFLSCAWLMIIRTAVYRGKDVFMGTCGTRITTAATYAAGITAVNLLSKRLESVFSQKPKSWYLYVSLPLMCIVLVEDLANWAASNGIMVQDRGRFGLYENQLFSHGAMCIFTALALAVSGFLVFGTDRIFREEKTREQYRYQVMCYQMMEEQYSQMERLRHDMKNHLIALENLVQNRQWDKAGTYLKEMADAGSVGKGDEVTGSLVMDALLCRKRQQAAERGIVWKCDARLPARCPVKEMDLCIIAGNILDNAVEACERLPKEEKPFVHVYIGTIKKCLFMEVKNSTDLADGSEICGSRKENHNEHGIGLANVKAAAASYSGAVSMEAKSGVFTISVLLPLYRKEDTV